MLSADDIETVSVGGLFGDVVVVVHGSGGVLVVWIFVIACVSD
jgi:hypothetical protein